MTAILKLIGVVLTLKQLAGYRTYIVAAVAGIVLALQVLGYLDAGTAQMILAALGITGVVTLRAALGQSEKPVETETV